MLGLTSLLASPARLISADGPVLPPAAKGSAAVAVAGTPGPHGAFDDLIVGGELPHYADDGSVVVPVRGYAAPVDVVGIPAEPGCYLIAAQVADALRSLGRKAGAGQRLFSTGPLVGMGTPGAHAPYLIEHTDLAGE